MRFHLTSPQDSLIRLASLAALVGLWHTASFAGVLNPNILPGPVDVATTIWTELRSGALSVDIVDSLRRVIIGFSIAAILGIVLGTVCALKPILGISIRTIVEALRPIPPIAWVPIALLWFGFGDPPAYFLVALGGFFPVFTNSFLGVSSVEPGSIEVARCHGATRKLTFTKVIWPQSLPAVFAGIKSGLGVAWMVVITAELVGAQSGLGYMIQISRAQLQAERVVAGMVLIGLIGFALGRAVEILERVALPWQPHRRPIVRSGL